MLRLVVEHVGEVRHCAGLGEAHVETIREAVAVNAMEGAHATRPMVGERKPITTEYFQFRLLGVGGAAHFETGREDDAVDFVFDAVHHHTLVSHALDALALGIHEGDIGTVESRQEVVIECGALAPWAIPGLERCGDGRIADCCIDPRAGFVHFLEVGNFGKQQHLLAAHVRTLVADQQFTERGKQLGPAIVNVVTFLRNAGHQAREVVIARRLPARL